MEALSLTAATYLKLMKHSVPMKFVFFVNRLWVRYSFALTKALSASIKRFKPLYLENAARLTVPQSIASKKLNRILAKGFQFVSFG